MKTRNVNLENTEILSNNICKTICLKAPTLAELEKKVKEYEMLLIKALTNKFRLLELNLYNNGKYVLLDDGNYMASMVLNFTGVKKVNITAPETTLQYIKKLTTMESKRPEILVTKPMKRPKIREHIEEIIGLIELNPEDREPDRINEIIAKQQQQLLEKIVTETNLLEIKFFITNKKQNPNTNGVTLTMNAKYLCSNIVEKSDEFSNKESR